VRCSPTRLHHITLFILAVVLLGALGSGCASADGATKCVLTHDALDKTLGALGDLRAQNLAIKIGKGSQDTEAANLRRQPKVEGVIKKRGLTVQEFILTYKAMAQIREAEEARDLWQRTLQDPDAAPQAKLEATQKLADSLKTNLFTPEQAELVRRHMPDLETLLSPPK